MAIANTTTGQAYSPFKYFSHNGTLLPISQAQVSLSNIEYTYGFGVYESIRVSNAIAWFAHQHIERLLDSARQLGLAHHFTAESLAKHIRTLMDVTTADAYNLKILLIGARNSADAQLNILPLAPVFPDRRWYKKGVAVVTQSYERFLPQVKSLNMLGSYLAYRTAKESGCYDCLLLNHDGKITEGTRTNVFGIKGKTLYSPPERDILPGITRMLVLETAKRHGYALSYESFSPHDMLQLDGAFLTSTSSKILPIKRIDQAEWSSIAAEILTLISHFDAFLADSLGVYRT